jgi:hypothetical protein
LQIHQGIWTVEGLFSERENINLNPQLKRLLRPYSRDFEIYPDSLTIR